jgi:hypothetical protein
MHFTLGDRPCLDPDAIVRIESSFHAKAREAGNPLN